MTEETPETILVVAADAVANALAASSGFSGVSCHVETYGGGRRLIVIDADGNVFEVEVTRTLKPAERR